MARGHPGSIPDIHAARRPRMTGLKGALAATVVAALATVSGAAWAHGDKAHDGTVGPVVKEQTDWGIAGDAKAVTRTVEIRMTDAMRFTPDRIEVRQGDTVRFVVRNTGKAMHEFVIGTRKELDGHAALMVKFPDMEHDEPYMAHVAPGQTGEIVWTFNRAGDFDFACLIAGHFQAGMVGRIQVASATAGGPAPKP